jgi:hypothetical protein
VIRSILAAVVLLLLIAPSPKGDKASPTVGEAVAREMRTKFCEQIMLLAQNHGGRVEADEFPSEAADCKSFADQAGPIVKSVTEKMSKDVAGLYEATRKLPEADRAKAKAAVWYGIAEGMR